MENQADVEAALEISVDGEHQSRGDAPNRPQAADFLLTQRDETHRTQVPYEGQDHST